MKIPRLYKIISTLLSLTILLSFTVSLCSISTMEEMCEEMMMEHNSSSEMQHHSSKNNMMHHNSNEMSMGCEMSFDCDCHFDAQPLTTNTTTIQLKMSNTPILIFVVNESNRLTPSKISRFSLVLDKSYSPPPLFLANESFLI